jgi:hypothetical protein
MWGSGSIAHRILNISITWNRVVSFTPLPLYTRGRSSWYPLIGTWERPQSPSGRFGEVKNLLDLAGNRDVQIKVPFT